MRKANILLIIALTLASLASVALNQVNTASAQINQPEGVVVEYVPGQSITIVDKQGNQSKFMLASSLKILPPEKANSITVGSIVTIIAPASISKGEQIAVEIVVHTDKELLPSATPWVKELLPSATPLVKNTPLPTNPPVTRTPKVSETPTSAESANATPESAVNSKQAGTAVKANSFIEWLRSVLLQLLGGQ